MRPTLLAVIFAASPALAQGFVCAEGGGNAGKGAWADEVFGWMVEKAGHGPVVILGVVPLDLDDRPALFTRLGAASVSSLVIDASNADTPATHDAIAAARLVFIRGGAQDRYVRFWKGTATQRAIVEVYRAGGVIAGTSAGTAVLGQVVYDSLHGSLTPREALADSRHEHLSLTTGFLDLVPGVLFDTHFTERARLARLPVMLAAAREDLHLPDLLGIGVDPRTAVCILPDSTAEIRGEGTATFLSLTEDSRIDLPRGKPPSVTNIAYTQLCAGYRYDLTKRQVIARPDSIHTVPKPADFSPPSRDLSIDGGTAAAADPGGAFTWTAASDDAWLTGAFAIEPCRAVFPDLIATTGAWPDHPANSVAAPQSILADHPGLVAAWIGAGSTARFDPRAWLDAVPGERVQTPLVVLNTRAATFTGRGPAPRHAPAIEHATLHLLAPGWSVNLRDDSTLPPGPSAVPTTDPANPGQSPH
jgi:cyanophycinase